MLALLTLCLAPTLCAQQAMVSGKGSVLTIRRARDRHRVVLPASVKVDMDTVEVLDSQNVGARSYLLLTVSGPSKRIGGGAGQCGAGTETAIIWLTLQTWRIREIASQLVESCWTNVTVATTIGWAGDEMRLSFIDGAPGSIPKTLRYDRDHAERGFTLVPP